MQLFLCGEFVLVYSSVNWPSMCFCVFLCFVFYIVLFLLFSIQIPASQLPYKTNLSCYKNLIQVC